MAWGVTLFGLQPAELDTLWPIFWALLSKANEFDSACMIDEWPTYEGLKKGNIVGLYRVDDGRMVMAMTLELKDTLRGRVCELTAIGGSGMKDWFNAIDGIESWAKSKECDFLSASGRPGWERVLKERGFRRVAITVEKALVGDEQ